MTAKKLVLGVGNDILMDDGIGPYVVEKMRKNNPINEVEYRTTTLGGLDIVDIINGRDQVLFVDAIKTKNGIPGTVYEYTPDDFKETLHLTNLHDISFLSAIELGKRLGFHIPKEITIFAVEIIEDQVFGDHFTPPLQKKLPQILDNISCRASLLLGG